MQSDEEREQVFWSYIEVAGPNDCWEWMRGLTRGGYGLFQVRKGKPRRAHRHAWSLVNGPIPNGLFVLHSCDTPSCVNPAHLHLGTNADNMREMKERSRWGEPRNMVRGERHHQAKLTDERVRHIRSSPESLLSLARRFGVSKKTILNVRHGRIWTHVAQTGGFTDARTA